MYSEKVMDHFENPRNVGEIPGADGIGDAAAIASSSMLTEMAKGKTLEDALQITDEAVAEMLDGLPPQKMHCSNMAADAMHKAIEDYRNRQGA